MGLGMPEVILILVIALIVFGPRKLPELGKSLGQAMSQFRRASEDFKRTWEQEVEMEKIGPAESKPTSPQSSSTSGYSSDYYSYGYEPEVGANSDTTAGSTAAQTTNGTGEAATAVSPAATETATAKAAEPAKPHWI